MKLAAVIEMRDELEDFIESFALKESQGYDFITLEVGLRKKDGLSTGWEDPLEADHDLAVEWFKLGVEMCERKLRAARISKR